MNVKSKAAAQNLDFSFPVFFFIGKHNQTITNMYCLCLKNKQEETSDVYEIEQTRRNTKVDDLQMFKEQELIAIGIVAEILNFKILK